MKFLDCFAGIGGFRLGLEKAGHACVGHIEIDKYANKSYQAIHNPKEDEYFATDITKIDPCELPDFDILCGGFPCQAFSISGKRRGFEDTRGTLIFDLLRIAKEKRPSYLFLENVRGLLSHDNGRTFETILKALDEIGYDAQWQVLNSKHFGVPQNRERVFIIGYLRGGCAGKVFPLREKDERLHGVLNEINIIGSTKGEHQTSIGQRNIVYHENGIIGALTSTDYKQPKMVAVQIDSKLNVQQYQNQQSVSLLNGEQIIIRKLTPRECFRLQGFPDRAFERARVAGLSDSQLYKQAGNSVTVNVIYEIAKRFITKEDA